MVTPSASMAATRTAPPSELAVLGGEPAVPKASSRVEWPVVTEDEHVAVRRVLESGRFTSNTMGEQEVRGLEREWAAHVGTQHCAAVANGTVAIALALAGLGVAPGEEVIVPALSFVATGLAPLQQLAIPVFADVDPVTFNIDPRAVEAALTHRTRAIVAVHLHGLPAEMDELRAIAERHHLALVEDAAQAHGAIYRGRPVGALGDAAAFSLNAAKNLPTCGEGGLVTTDDAAVHERIVLLRQFGESLSDDQPRLHRAEVLGFNHKLNAVQAAFTRAQLRRFGEYGVVREANVRGFLERVGALPGVTAPLPPPDRTHAWHILRFRFSPAEAGFDDVDPGAFRVVLQRVLRAEGVPLSQYQVMPLPSQPAFRDRGDGFGRGMPWTLNGAASRPCTSADVPNAVDVVETTLTLQKRHLPPTSGPLLEGYATAFEKVWEHLDVVARRARTLTYRPAWRLAEEDTSA